MRAKAARAAAAAGCFALVAAVAAATFPWSSPAVGAPAPRFTHADPADWINSPPLTLRALRGRVVLIDFWTFGCVNCYRSIPWLKDIERRYAERGLQVVGVHTPEFEHEKDPARVRAKVAEFGLEHPVMLDNDLSYWRAMRNRYWPAFYVLDRRGVVRGVFVGEMHVGQARSRPVEELLERLLGEGA